jgi:hypothetical protein
MLDQLDVRENPPMPRRMFVLLMLFCAFFAAPFSARADDIASVKATLQSIYNQADAAFAQKDIEGYMAPVDLDVRVMLKDRAGATYSDLRKVMEFSLSLVKSVTAKTVINQCTAQGNGVVTVIKVRRVATVDNPRTLKVSTVVAIETIREYWEQTDDGWHIMQMRVLTSTVTLDGKQIASFASLAKKKKK